MLGEIQGVRTPKEELRHLVQCGVLLDSRRPGFADRGPAECNFSSGKTQAEPEDLSVRMPPTTMHDVPHQAESNASQAGGAPAEIEMMGGRKMIGIRYLFPQFPDQMSLLQRTRIWVARHDYGYFVGWSEQELQKVDAILRPIRPITLQDYKKHMNRSEFCRNVKLKYCLEADTPWARDFRDRLSCAYQQGGFKGLCDVKQAAAELWRKYSERYRGNQARYPNPKSKYKMRHDERIKDEDEEYMSPKRPRLSVECREVPSGVRSTNSSPGTYSAPRGLPSPTQESGRPLSADAAPAYHIFESQQMELIESASQSVCSPKDGKPAACHRQSPEQPISYSKILNGAIERLCRQSTIVEYKGREEDLQREERMQNGFVHQEEPATATRWQRDLRGDVDSSRLGQLELPRFFPPAPPVMSVADCLDLWLDRHRRSYFVNVSPADLEHVPSVLRPTHTLTSANMEQCVPGAFREAMEHFIAVKASADPCAVRFKEMLLLSPEEGGFSSAIDALQEAISVHKQIQYDQSLSIMNMRKHDKRSFDDDRSVVNGNWVASDLKHRLANGKQQAGSMETQQRCAHTPRMNEERMPRPDSHLGHEEMSHVRKCLHSINGNQPPYTHDATPEIIGRHSNDLPGSREYPAHRTVSPAVEHKLSESPGPDVGYIHANHHKESSDSRSLSSPYATHVHSHPLISARLGSPPHSAPQGQLGCDKMEMVRSLWSYRRHLQALLRDDPRLSWRQKLEPFMPVLRNISGDQYEVPDCTTDCAVDLVLAVLHSAIMDH